VKTNRNNTVHVGFSLPHSRVPTAAVWVKFNQTSCFLLTEKYVKCPSAFFIILGRGTTEQIHFYILTVCYVGVSHFKNIKVFLIFSNFCKIRIITCTLYCRDEN
jgi:hypothetical protein